MSHDAVKMGKWLCICFCGLLMSTWLYAETATATDDGAEELIVAREILQKNRIKTQRQHSQTRLYSSPKLTTILLKMKPVAYQA